MSVRLSYDPCIKHAAEYWLRSTQQSNRRGNYGYPNPKYWDDRRRREFEDWLWSQQVRLVRDNKQYYLEFLNESTASMFALKWSQSRITD